MSAVTNEAGDSIEVSDARPGPLKIVEEGGFVGYSDCTSYGPYVGGSYDACGYVSFYDANWESTHAPYTNVEEDAEYDACGTKISSGSTEGWRVTGTNYTRTGWHQGHPEEVPVSEPTSCLGTWTELYVWTETFSDGETLSDSIEVPFTVTSVPIGPSETWGGGNPAELPCSQSCTGDPVNTASGDYSESVTDLVVPGRGLGLKMTRTYSSLAARAGVSSPLGRGWAFPYGSSLAVNSETGVVTITNPNGSRTVFNLTLSGDYVAPPRVLATLVKHEDGTYAYTVRKRTIYTFSASGSLIGIADLNGNEVDVTHGESGEVTEVKNGAGRTIAFAYEGGKITKATDSSGRSVSYGYNGSGYLTEVTDVRGGTSRYTYNEGGLLLTHEDPRENVVLTNTYDSEGRVLTQTDGLEHETTYSYEEEGETETTDETDPRGYVTEYEYKGGALAKKTEAKSTESAATWTYERDPNTLGITGLTDPNGHTSHATYDASGNKTSTEDGLGDKTESAYDSLDDLTEYTDAEGVTTTYEYDERGNLLKSATPLEGSEESRTTAYSYEDEEHSGDASAITDPDGNMTHFSYDEAGDLTSVTDAEGDETTYEYDEIGRRLTQVSPRGNAEGAEPSKYTTTYTYDAAGDRLTETDPLGHERKWAYNADGDVKEETDAKGQTTTYAYDANNERTKTEKPNGDTTETAYDADGDVSSQTNGLGHATTYAYDPLDHLSSSTDPLERTSTYSYDGAGNLKSKEDPEGRTTTYAYDKADRLAEVAYSDESTPDVEYGYDKDGRRTSMSDGMGKSTYEYDSLGRLTSTTDGHGDTTSFGYDLAGNETAIAYPNSKEVTRSYDEAEHLASVTDWLGNKTSFSYDPNSDLTATTFPEVTGNVDEYAYNRADQMSSVAMTKGKETLASLSYSRDKAGQLESLTSEGLPGPEEEAFAYDEGSRLTEGGSEAFGYNAADNLTKAPGTTNSYDKAGQLESSTGVEYTYDKEGERTKATPAGSDEAPAYSSSGSGEGQLNEPTDLAVDPSGNVWIAGNRNNRIQEFGPSGSLIRAVGSYGAGEGQFHHPFGIATASNGNIWAADTENNRIEEFTEEGEFIRSCGTKGSGEGQFYNPEGLAVDAEGNVYVADRANNRIEEVSETCSYLGSIPQPEGVENGPFDVALDPSGNLWVAYGWDEKIAELSPGGEPIAEWGEKGSEPGQLKNAYRLDIGPEGNVWVAEYSNHRVQAFTPAGKYLYGFGSQGSGPGQFEHARGIGFSPSGEIAYALDSGNGGKEEPNNRVERWTLSKPINYSSTFASPGSGEGQLNEPADLAVDPSGNVWIAGNRNHRIQEFGPSGEPIRAVGSEGSGEGQFRHPFGIATATNGDVWAADTEHDRIEEFSEEGEFIRSCGEEGSGEGQFRGPDGMAVDPEGNVWVADRGNNRVEEVSETCSYLGSISKPEEENGPFDVTLDPSGNIWVAYGWDEKVAEFSPEGEPIAEWGEKGSEPGELKNAYRLDIGPEGNVWVAEYSNRRVQVFKPDGKYLYGFGSQGSGPGQFEHARGIGFSPSGEIAYALDSGNGGKEEPNNRVERWTLKKTTTYSYDQAGNLTAVERPEASETPAIEETYGYDGNGLRASQTVSGAKSYLTWDQTGALPLLLSDGSTSYIYGPGGLPVEQISEETPTFYHHDQLGSTRMLTNSSGKATATFSYGAYGEQTGLTGTQTTPLGYAGQYTSEQSGLIYMRARVYGPTTGQFLSTDPVSFMTREPYSYTSDNPLANVDPSGLCNAEFWTGSFWTEGNCLSESPLNPIPYYEREIEAIEAGCSYWDAVSYGLRGAGVLTVDAAALLTAGMAAPEALDVTTSLAREFALKYPNAYLFILNQASKVGTGPPVGGTVVAFFWSWMEEHLRH